jgi:hypothetical protein
MDSNSLYGYFKFCNTCLNVAKSLVWDNKNTDIYVSAEYISKIEQEVENWK